jgi:hypothetical protein
MRLFLAGVISLGFLVAAVFFVKFWRQTRDTLFAAFAIAFALLALNQAAASLLTVGRDELEWVWLLRLAAYCAIVGAIVWKNLGPEARRGSAEKRSADLK